MQKRLFPSATALAILLALFLGAGSAFAVDQPVVLARVGGIPVTKYELQREVQKAIPLQVSFHGRVSQEKMADIRETAMKKLIERAFMVRFALGNEIALDNKAVDSVYKPIRDKFKTQSEYDKALNGESDSDFRASIYRELLARKAEALAVDDKVKVTDQQVRDYYDRNVTSYVRPKQFKASHILVKVDPAATDEERLKLLAKARDLARKAEAGEDFYNLAYHNSDDRSKFVGGALGFFHIGQTVKEFEDALLKMNAGSISGPVKTLYGYHIIKLDEVHQERQLTYDEVKETIRQALTQRERDRIYEEWIGRLREKNRVERFDA